ncbi:MAG: carbohydrate ABC transporter permease, partial [Clostridia bacterium]|nr:carbohydrate ABC transporter permease [Clostridia bacterium]
MIKNYNALRYYKKTVSASGSLFFYVFLISIAFVFIYPFFYMFSTSLKSYQDLYNISVNWIPTKLEFRNYATAAGAMELSKTMLNSVIVTFLATLGHVISGAFIGYGFARFEFPFKNLFFVGSVLSTIIPIQVFIIPMYVTYSNLNMLDTFMPFIL